MTNNNTEGNEGGGSPPLMGESGARPDTWKKNSAAFLILRISDKYLVSLSGSFSIPL